MMTINQNKMNSLLKEIVEKLDISPSKYQQAVERYESVGNWLDAESSELKPFNPKVFPQGSFRLGTPKTKYR